MRIAIISDVHGNLVALEAVLADMKAEGVERLVSLGDNVGYGPWSKESDERVREEAQIMVRGNHEELLTQAFTMPKAIDMLFEVSKVKLSAQRTILSAAECYTEETIKKLQKLPIQVSMIDWGMAFQHACCRKPGFWTYVVSERSASYDLKGGFQPVNFIGHSHISFFYSSGLEDLISPNNLDIILSETNRYLINVGSVGQPRDRDPRACYAIIELGKSKKLYFRRVEYDIEKTVKGMRRNGFDEELCKRLFKAK